MISSQQWLIYDEARVKGLNQAQAARLASLSLSSAKVHENRHPDRANYNKAARLARNQPDPQRTGKLCTDAQRALKDFNYFQLRYLGRIGLPWQEESAQKIVELVESPDKEFAVVNGPPGGGKALALDTPILTTLGWSTMKDIEIGDRVFDERGKPCPVTWKSEVFYDHDCYEVSTDDGASVIADGAHEWPVRLHGYRPIERYAGQTGPKPRTEDGVHSHETRFLAQARSKRPQLAVAKPLEMRTATLPIDPYVLGVWLGDGSATGAVIACHDDDAGFMRSQIEAAGYVTTNRSRMAYGISGPTPHAHNGFRGQLRVNGLLGNKHIPVAYLRAHRLQRLSLLQGLIDTDGYVSPGGNVEFTNTNRGLAEAVQFLARSLGVKASLKGGRATLNGRDCGPKYRVGFYMKGAARLPRKAALCRDGARTPGRYLTVTPVESVPTQCIEVGSPSNLYLAGTGLLVTHNSSHFTYALPLWLIVRDRAIRCLIGSATGKLAGNYTAAIRRALEATTPITCDDEDRQKAVAVDAVATLSEDFGRFKPATHESWTKDAFIVEQFEGVSITNKEPTVTSVGRDQEFIGGRYDFCVWDDLVTVNRLRTIEMIEKDRDWWDTYAERRLEPAGLLLLQGQRMGPSDLYRYCLDKVVVDIDDADPDDGEGVALREGDDGTRRQYHHIVYLAHYDDRCKGAEGHKRAAAPYPEGCLLSPRRITWREISSIRHNRPDTYAQVYQQEDAAADYVLVDPSWISGTGGFPGCWDNQRDRLEIPQGIAGPVFSIATVDPSPTRYWAIEWWLYVQQTDEWILIDLLRTTMDGPDLLDWNQQEGKWFGVMQDWQNKSVELGVPISHWIVEQNGAQRWLLRYNHVHRWQGQNSVQIIPHDTYRNKANEQYGVQMIAPAFKFGRVRLPGKGDGRICSLKLIGEVTRYTTSGHGGATTDDTVMACWFGMFQMQYLSTPVAQPHHGKRPSWIGGRTLSRVS